MAGAVLFVCGGAMRAKAEGGETKTQYSISAWQTEDGLPSNSVQSVVQTRDGYLWLGTKSGLVRFDGVRFTIYDKRNTPEIKSNDVLYLYEDRAGDLWAGTQGGGLVRYGNGKFRAYTVADGLASNLIGQIREDAAGDLWVGTTEGLCRFRDGSFRTFTTRDGLTSNNAANLAVDAGGNLWVGTPNGLNLFKDERAVKTYTTQDNLPHNNVTALLALPDASVLIGTTGGLARWKEGVVDEVDFDQAAFHTGVRSLCLDRRANVWIGTVGAGLFLRDELTTTSYGAADGLASDYVGAIFEDREGSVWVGTYGGGLNRLKRGQFMSYGVPEGLSNNFAFSIHEDRDGTVWVGTYGGGLNRLRDGRITNYTKKDGLSSDIVRAVFADSRGVVWVGTYGGGLNKFTDGKFTAYGTADGLSSNFIYSIYEDRRGDLWVGTDHGVSQLHEGRWTAYAAKDGLPDGAVRSMLEDRAGNLWFGTYGGGLARFRDGRFTALTMKDGLSDDFIRSIYEDRDGMLWVGTYGGGINRLSDGRVTAYTTKEGLYDNGIYQIMEDDRGNFWMSCNQGVFFVSRASLNDFAEGKTKSISCVAYGRRDGMRASECNGGNQPAGWKMRDGKLWFPTVKGVAVIDPSGAQVNELAPPVVIESLIVNGQEEAAVRDGLRFAPDVKKFEFHYTGLSFLVPQKVKFKYQLEGFDRDWVEADTRRAAYYTHLPPGDYTFRVIACNNDGVWNYQGAALRFSLAPHFYQTKIFYALCLLGLLLLGAGFSRLRVSRLKKRAAELVALVGERTRLLEEANQSLRQLSLSDSLTGIANRRRFDEFLEAEWRRAVRNVAPLSLMLIDVDYFKHYNDHHGHQGGDECLRKVAEVLSTGFKRPGDLLARYGGDEFIGVLGDAGAEQAADVARRLREGVEALRLPHPARPDVAKQSVTITLGVATVVPSRATTPKELITAADHALYQAKQRGRNTYHATTLDSPVIIHLK